MTAVARPVATVFAYLTALAIAAAALAGFWYWQGRPMVLPDVAGVDHKLQCVSYSPFDKDQTPLEQPFVLRPERMDADLALLAKYFSCVRTYSMTGMEQLPAIAARHGLTVMLGGWVSADPKATKLELDLLVEAANDYPDVVRAVVVGNETLLRKEVSGARLAKLITEVKHRVSQPVTYADVWEFWEKHPEVAPAVDFITIHLLPYWEDEPAGIDDAIAKVARVRERYGKLFAPKDILIGETGWPSQGRQRETALPSRVNEARFMREFVTLAEQKGWHYNLIEAFDQPWKRVNEGAVGGYWGLFDADRHDKSILAGPVSNLPNYKLWIEITGVVLLCGLAIAGRPRDIRAAIAIPLLSALAGGCLGSWWVQAMYANRDSGEWLWTAALSLLNLGVLIHALQALGTRRKIFAWFERNASALLMSAGFVAALCSIQFVFDARYRLFSPGVILLPALVFLWRPASLPLAQARLLTAIVALSLPWLIWQEKPVNMQALIWIATAALMAAALYRGYRRAALTPQASVASAAALP